MTFVTGTVASVYGTDRTVCSIQLPAGYNYLLLGMCQTSIGHTTCMGFNLSGCDLSTGTIRTTMLSGGGATTWGWVMASESVRTISLVAYGYANATYNHVGRIMAIRMGKETIGGG